MPVNDKKPITPEDIATQVFNTFFGGVTPPKPAADTTVPDSFKETYRLLQKAEEVAEPDEAAKILQIVDRHLRLIDLAVSSQK